MWPTWPGYRNLRCPGYSAPDGRVSDDKRQRVRAAAQELGYHPNAIARSLTTERTNTIGMVMANLTSPFYPYALEKFLQRFQQIGKQALLFTVAHNQSVDELTTHIFQHRVDALIVASATLSSDMADACLRYGTPVILFNRYAHNTSANAVCSDNVEGGRRAADLLLDTGHQRIAYIAGESSASTNQRTAKRGLAIVCANGA